MREYHRLLEEIAPAASEPPADHRGYIAGPFGRLVSDYLASGTFREKNRAPGANAAESSRPSLQHGDKPVRQLERRHVCRMRDERADTPGAANTILRTLKLLLSFALEDGNHCGEPSGTHA